MLRTLVLAGLAGLALGLVLPSPAQALGQSSEVACCDNLDAPDSCWLVDDATDLSPCDPAAELGLCTVDGIVLACKMVALRCCDVVDGVVWLDSCSPLDPGETCGGAVVGRRSS